ncbi:MFS transporter [Mycobacterium sp. AT1]|nr:MFS transporter [Mycobacterium sp. AT1]
MSESVTKQENSEDVDRTTQKELVRAARASMIGTTVEWYDFFVYASAAGLVFSDLFFSQLGASAAILASLATIGVSFLARPLGGIVAGHLGDRWGRKAMLVVTLLLMGVSTVGVGLLPTYAEIGIAAPILLVALRFLQGISAGGEWGGAALMSVEHAPAARRGYYGSAPQLGTPLGLLLATGVFLAVSTMTTHEQFRSWGWRIPFLLSAVLIVIGFYVRSKVNESPVFAELKERKKDTRAPLSVLFRDYRKELLVGIGLFIACNLNGYMLIGFLTSYGTKTLGKDTSTMLLIGSIGAIGWGVSTVLAAQWSDRVGRRRTYIVGAIVLGAWTFPFFVLLDTANLPLMVLAVLGLTVGLGLTYGPQAAAYAEMFPAAIRYSGASLAYAIGAVLGGGFAPLIAAWLVGATGSSLAVSAYMFASCLLTLAAALAMQQRSAAENDAFVRGVTAN